MGGIGVPARVNHVDGVDGDVGEGAGAPAKLYYGGCCAFPDCDALDQGVGVVGFDGVVVGVVEDVAQVGVGIDGQTVGLSEEGADLFIVVGLNGDGVKVAGEVEGVERWGGEGDARKVQGLRGGRVGVAFDHFERFGVLLVVGVGTGRVGLVDVLFTGEDAITGEFDTRGIGVELDRSFYIGTTGDMKPVHSAAEVGVCGAGEVIDTRFEIDGFCIGLVKVSDETRFRAQS